MAKNTQKTENQNHNPTDANENFLKKFDMLISGAYLKDDLKTSGGKVPADEADPCISQFATLAYGTRDENLPAAIRRGFTKSVSFTGADLNAWIKEMVDKGENIVNNIRIVFAVYTDKYVNDHPAQIPASKKYRLTVFLWPYKDDSEAIEGTTRIPPYNLGGLEP